MEIQVNMHLNFVSSNDTGEISTIFVWSDNEEVRLRNETHDIIKRLTKKKGYCWEMEVILCLKALIYCLIIFKKQVWKEEVHT